MKSKQNTLSGNNSKITINPEQVTLNIYLIEISLCNDRKII